MRRAPAIDHNVGYADGPAIGVPVQIPTRPVDPDPLSVDPRALPPSSPHAGGRDPEPEFVENLRLADERMVVFWNPMLLGGRWVIWRKSYTGQFTLVMPVWNPDTKEYWPLDNRALALIHHADPARYGGVREMFLQVRARAQLEADAQKKRTLDRIDEAQHLAKQHSQIRTGYGHSPGNRASQHAHWDKGSERLSEEDNPIR